MLLGASLTVLGPQRLAPFAGAPVDMCISSILTAPGTGIGAWCSLLSCSLLIFYLPVFHFKHHDKKSHNIVNVAIHATATWHLIVKAEGKPWSLRSARTESQLWHWMGTVGPLCTGQLVKQIFFTDISSYLHGFGFFLQLGQFIYEKILSSRVTCFHFSSFEDIAISVSSYLMND